MTPTWRTLLVVAVVLLAGCTGGLGGDLSGDGSTADGTATDGDSATDGPTTAEGTSGETARMNFYVSDEPNRIDDFRHLNVTVTKVGLKRADAGGNGGEDGGEDGDDDAENRTAEENDGEEANEGGANATTTGTAESTENASAENVSTENASADAEDAGAAGEGDWIEYEVDNRTVDLTELRGANASKLDVIEVPEGEYETVFVHVGETEGILEDGTETNVKLPSDKLQVHTAFTVAAGEDVDFVFDIGVHEAGNSGKYILKPVISESGTGDDVEIRDVDGEDADEKRGDDERGNGDGDDGEEGDANDGDAADDEGRTGDDGEDGNGEGPPDEAGGDGGDGAGTADEEDEASITLR